MKIFLNSSRRPLFFILVPMWGLWAQFPSHFAGARDPNANSPYNKCSAMLAFRNPIVVRKICGPTRKLERGGAQVEASEETACTGKCSNANLEHSLCLDNGLIIRTDCQLKQWKCSAKSNSTILPNTTCEALVKLEGGLSLKFPNLNASFTFQLKKCLVWSLSELDIQPLSSSIAEPMPFKDLHRIASHHESSQHKDLQTLSNYVSVLEKLKEKYQQRNDIYRQGRPHDQGPDSWVDSYRLGPVDASPEAPNLRYRRHIVPQRMREKATIVDDEGLRADKRKRPIGPCWVFPLVANEVQTFMVEECVLNSKDIDRCRRLIEVNSLAMALKLKKQILGLQQPQQRPIQATRDIDDNLKKLKDNPRFIESYEDQSQDDSNIGIKLPPPSPWSGRTSQSSMAPPLKMSTLEPTRTLETTFTTSRSSTTTKLVPMTSSTTPIALPSPHLSASNHSCEPFWKLNDNSYKYCSIPPEMSFCLCATSIDNHAVLTGWDRCHPQACSNNA